MAVRIQPDGWDEPRGYANGMRARGELLAIAGQIAWNARRELVSDDFVAQFAQALANVVDVVRAAGGGPEHVVSLTLYVLDCKEYVARRASIGESYRAIMGLHYPAMALVQVAGLVDPGAKVEIQGLAVLP